MDPPPTNSDLSHRFRMLELQNATILWLSGLNFFMNVATIAVAALAVWP